MAQKRFTNELKKTFEYIQNTLLKDYDSDNVTTEYFILSVLENDDSVANKILTKIMLQDSMESAKLHFYQWLSQNAKSFGGKKGYDSIFERSIKSAKEMAVQCNSKSINSGHVLFSVFKNNPDIVKYFRTIGVTPNQINTQVIEETNAINEEEKKNSDASISKSKPIKHQRKVSRSSSTVDIKGESEDIISVSVPKYNGFNLGECEKYFKNLNRAASEGHIDLIYGNESVYEEIFNILSKRNKSNVILVGKSGVGKTETVRNLANLIISGNVPISFKDKVLMEFDFNSLISGAAVQGAFETRVRNIISDAKQNGNYIFFIDSIETLKNELIEEFVSVIAKEKGIMLICAVSESGYTKKISDFPSLERYFEKIDLAEVSEEDCLEILKLHASKLEYFHYVKYDESMFKSCIKLCKRYITERCLPDSAIDILDKTGAKASLNDVENDNITSAREKLYKIKEEKEKLKNSSSKKDYNKIDQLSKEEIELNTILNFAVKSYNLEKQPFVVRENDIRECISEKTGIPINSLSTDDKEKLKGLNERIKSVVIGQDEAVDEVCKSIKRQRVGISNPNKPVVFLLAGSTGVGKTYLAKTLAKEVFGDEKKFVRLDMSEYADKTSISKLIGTGAGYVGYDNGGLLTETIKRNKHCVLLLDEIEKANEEVHNTFLSLFDEGRLTDNKGVTVNFKDVIIIMTSNVGAKEVEERGGSIGFVNNEESNKKSIIEKELKRKFKPEFINRIDKIVYFNKLTDSNIKNIILLELNKTKKRVEEIGYYLSDELIKNHLVSNIFNKVKEHKNMGARPIIREIQNELEDKITDLIIDGLVEKGHTFTKEELGC